jgi:tetratricopeptide (TPR) repeat protein
VVLDNAAGAQQVRPLLPAAASCGVLVTSRQALVSLEGARLLRLDVLPVRQAIGLLERVAGPSRVNAEPRAAAEVVGYCGRLPLAIQIAGARLAARPGWPVAALATLLADSANRLSVLEVADVGVRASFDVSVDALELARGRDDRAAEALAHNDLGGAYVQQGRYEEARASLLESLRISKDLGDRRGQAATLGNLGVIHLPGAATRRRWPISGRA